MISVIIHSMGDFNRGNRSGGEHSFGGRRDFNNRGTDRPTILHKTICSKCRKECEVPFRPTGSKPVFCRDCFRDNGGSDSRRSDKGNFSRPSFDNRFDNRSRNAESPQYKEQLEALNIKLDRILKILTPVVPKEKAPVVQEEKIVKKVEVLQLKEQVVVPEKKRVSKKVPLTPEEQP